MRIDEYRNYDMMGLAELIAAGEVSAAEVRQAGRAAISKVNAELNAVANGPWEPALDCDEDGRFAGIPFVIKDLVCHPAGVKMTSGSRIAGEGVTYDYDTHLMQRFREAGLAAVALTTCSEFGIGATSEALVYGPTHNPWDLSRSLGGSSGGTAALVASRAVPAGYGNDGAGSIRIPAAYCGLVGLKPGRGRIPAGPDSQELLFATAVEFAMTRTVRDTAALLDAVTGPMPGDKFAMDPPTRPFLDEVGTDPGRLRIAVHPEPWAGTDVAADVRETVDDVADKLESLGHQVERATPQFSWQKLMEAELVLWSITAVEAARWLAKKSGLKPGEDTLERVTLNFYEQGKRLSAMDVTGARATINKISRAVGEFFTEWDVLLTPTTNTTAPPLGHLDQNADLAPEAWFHRNLEELCAFTPLFNVTGTPAISLPLGLSEEGLPIGVQLAADMGEESKLLRLAGQLEAALPWGERIPEVCAAL